MTNVVHTKQFKTMSAVYDVVLRGGDLWSKSGFGDGNLIDEHAWEIPELEKLDDDLHFDKELRARGKETTIFNRVCTMALVELYLLPKFDRTLTLFFANYSHNGVRVSEREWWDTRDYEWEDKNLPSVTITGQHVLEIMWAMKCVFEQWLADKPMVFPSALTQTANVIADELKCEVIIDNQLEFTCSSPNLLPSAVNPQS